MTFKVDDLVRVIEEYKTDYDDYLRDIMRVLETDTNTIQVSYGNDDGSYWFPTIKLELVTDAQDKVEPVKPPIDMSEQTVAIVSFEGAVKREARAVREALKTCDSISGFHMEIVASGPINDGEVNIVYKLCPNSSGYDAVEGSSVKECVAEMVRRHGWDLMNKPKAISYQEVPF